MTTADIRTSTIGTMICRAFRRDAAERQFESIIDPASLEKKDAGFFMSKSSFRINAEASMRIKDSLRIGVWVELLLCFLLMPMLVYADTAVLSFDAISTNTSYINVNMTYGVTAAIPPSTVDTSVCTQAQPVGYYSPCLPPKCPLNAGCGDPSTYSTYLAIMYEQLDGVNYSSGWLSRVGINQSTRSFYFGPGEKTQVYRAYIQDYGSYACCPGVPGSCSNVCVTGDIIADQTIVLQKDMFDDCLLKRGLPGYDQTQCPYSDKPDGDKGSPDNNDDPGCGSPTWSVNKTNLNLYVTDTPLWYKPPYGPSVNIQLSYNSQGSATGSPFGSKWQFNYASYLIENSGSVTVVMPDGRNDVYTLNGGVYQKPFGVFNTLVNIGQSSYTLLFPDSTVYTYTKPAGVSGPVLTDVADAYNKHLYIDYNTSGQITQIRDALMRATTFHYNAQGLIDTITDPFVVDPDFGTGRTATFTYYPNTDLLKRATDMGGYWSEYSYDASGYLSSITSPDPSDPNHIRTRTWGFRIEPSGNETTVDPYPAPGAPMGKTYRVTITDPTGHKEEYFYYGQNTWYVSPRDYVNYIDSLRNNLTQAPKTFYYYDSSLRTKGKVAKILTPGGTSNKYTFDSSTGKVVTKEDTLDGLNWNRTRYEYNSNGLTTKIWQPKTPDSSPATIINTYQNDLDLQTVDNHLGTPITYEYTDARFPHSVTSVTDHMGVKTVFGYNDYGQLNTITEAKGTRSETLTELIYDTGKYTLKEIKKAGISVAMLSFDDMGRIQSVSYPDGVTVNYIYDNLNQTKTVIYPDGKTDIIANSAICPYLIDSTTDRGGLTTNFSYDSLKRLVQRTGPDGTFKYGYDFNGNMTTLTDPMNKVTSFGYDYDNRLATKTYADGKNVSYTYNKAGLMDSYTGARSTIAYYYYDANHNLTTIAYYYNIAPQVSFTYDAYDRIWTRTDGIGKFTFKYDNNSRLTDVAYPWDNVNNPNPVVYTLRYGYDELNRLTSVAPLTPPSSQPVSYTYDSIGRLWKVQRGSDAPFVYSYETASSPLETQLTRPNGSYTQYQYNDPLKKLTGIFNRKSNNDLINSFVYTYTDPKHPDFRSSETSTNGLVIDNFINGTTNYTPNNLNQITDTTNPALHYVYDNDGNMTTGFSPSNQQLTMEYDAENRMTKSYPDSTHKTIYSYSGDGLLAQIVKPSGETIRYIRAGFLPIQERDASNNVTREYIWGKNMGGGIGGLLNLRQNGNDYNYLYDGKGNVITLIDNTQAVVANYAYNPFGILKKSSLALGFSDQPFKFSTKQYDPDTGLYYYGFRYYDPVLGTWTSRDPLGEDADPNLYRGMRANAVNFVDPKGSIIWIDDCIACINKQSKIQKAEDECRNELKQCSSDEEFIEKYGGTDYSSALYNCTKSKTQDDIWRSMEKSCYKCGIGSYSKPRPKR